VITAMNGKIYKIMTPFRTSAITLTSLPDCSITVLRLSSTLRLLSKVSASLKRLISPVIALVRNGAKIFASKSIIYRFRLAVGRCWMNQIHTSTHSRKAAAAVSRTTASVPGPRS
jgi:hypothetical protein